MQGTQGGMVAGWRWSLLVLVPAIASVLSLLAPWVYLGSRGRSSIDLIASAGAIDLIEGPTRLAVVLAWLLAPLLAAGATIAAAANRPRLAAAVVAPLGPFLGVVAAVVVIGLGELAGWGAWLCATLAVVTTVAAVVVMAKGPARR